jgi:long-subunit acyl-CoA synthetase (AMP-forming)
MINSNCKLFSVGKPIKGVKIRIEKQDGEIGEILYNCEDMMGSYYKSELISRDLFIHSGDLGFIDDSGDLTILGRLENFNTINNKIDDLNKIKGIIYKINNDVFDNEPRKFFVRGSL